MMVAPKAGHASSVLLLVWLVASSTPLAELCCHVLLHSVVPGEGLMGCAAEGFSKLMQVLILKKESF